MAQVPTFADADFVPLDTIAGIMSVVISEDGTALVTFANGDRLIIAAEDLRVLDSGEILVSPDQAIEIAALLSEAGGLGVGMIAAAGGGALAVLAALVGGGDGGGPQPIPPPPEPPPIVPPPDATGRVIDGYVAGATVFRDNIANRQRDASEPATQTDGAGLFRIADLPGGAYFVARGGIDIATGLPFTGTLMAPGTASVITPLTTIIQANVLSSGGALSVVAAQNALAGVLGLGPLDILNTDPVATDNLALLKAGAQVMTVLTLAEAVGGDPFAIAVTLGQSLQSGSAVLTDATTLETVLRDAGLAARGADLAQAAAQANLAIAGATTVQGVTDVQVLVQGQYVQTLSEGGQIGGIDVVSPPDAAPSFASLPSTINAAMMEAGVIVTGRGRPGTQVILTFDGVDLPPVGVDAVGNWLVQIPSGFRLAGGLDVSVVARSSATAFSPERTVFLDTIPPVVPSIQTVAGDDLINAAERVAGVTVSGLAEAGSTVTLQIGMRSWQVIAAADRQWDVPLTTADLPISGTLRLTAFATDSSGNRSGAATRDVTVDAAAPAAPLIDLVAGDDIVNLTEAGAALVLTGVAEQGSRVAVSLGDTSVAVFVNDEGIWEAAFAAVNLPADGPAVVSATAQDAADKVSATATRAITIETALPLVDFDADPSIPLDRGGAAGIEITGTTDAPVGTVALSVVQGEVGLSFAGAITQGAGGNLWSVTLDEATVAQLAEGVVRFAVTVTSPAGNTGLATVDFVLPPPDPPMMAMVFSLGDDAIAGMSFAPQVDTGAENDLAAAVARVFAAGFEEETFSVSAMSQATDYLPPLPPPYLPDV